MHLHHLCLLHTARVCRRAMVGGGRNTEHNTIMIACQFDSPKAGPRGGRRRSSEPRCCLHGLLLLLFVVVIVIVFRWRAARNTYWSWSQCSRRGGARPGIVSFGSLWSTTCLSTSLEPMLYYFRITTYNKVLCKNF